MRTDVLENKLRGVLKGLDITHMEALIILSQAYIVTMMTLLDEGIKIPDDIQECFEHAETGEPMPLASLFNVCNKIVSPLTLVE